MRFVNRAAAVTLVVGILLTTTAGPAVAAPVHARIEGTGSSWSGNAMNLWISAATQQGVQVVFTATGSATGRRDFAYQTTDFGVTDIPYQGSDPLTGAEDTAHDRPYVYLPIVAGGTSFPYQIRVGGQLVRNLRLSGQTLAKIFTAQITNWNDPQITADNNGRQLPSITIKPIVHSEGSGSTAQFTAYLAKEYPQIWGAYAGHAVETEYFPARNTHNDSNHTIAQNGSDGVMNTLVATSNNGTIAYDEYSYALAVDYPVAKIENTAGYFTLPTDYNVAVSLTQAVIDDNPSSPTYLIQKLDNVYVYNDKRTYPMSSYSYLILPTGPDGSHPETKMTTGKRQTLADFTSYTVCTGQRSMGPLGYSPLPINLVQAGFAQIAKLKVRDPAVVLDQQPINNCSNPTFVAGHPEINHLAQIAPMPPDCDKSGAGPCGATGGTGTGGTGNGGTGTGGTGTGGTGTGAGGTGTGAAGATPSAGAGTVIDPDTGQVVGAGSGGDANAAPTPTTLSAFRNSAYMRILVPLSVALLLSVLFVPALLNRRYRNRRR